MSFKTLGLSEDLHAYVVGHAGPLDDLMTELIAVTRERLAGQAQMQVAPEQAAFLTLLVQMLGAHDAIEIGTFTGLSSLAIARGLPADGHLLCCDISAEYTAIAQEYWQRAGVADRIELRIGPAAQTLHDLPAGPQLDFAFVDADKTGYPGYWQELVPRMRPGGVIALDNTLRHGRVLEPAADDLDTAAIVAFNDLVLADDRVDSMLLPVGDGTTLARRR